MALLGRMAPASRLRDLGVALVALLAAALYWSPAFLHLDSTGYGDWQPFHHQWEAGYVAVMRFGEFPLWNPFQCGGVMLFGDPQAQVYSPLFWLLLPLGTTLALKVFLLLHCAAGLWGMYVFTRRELGCRAAAAMLSAAIWGASGFFAWHGSGGHSAFLPFYFAPWLLLAWRRAARDPRWGAAVAGIMTLTLLEGGVYPFPFFCLLLAFDGIVRMARPGERAGVIRAGLVAVPLMLLMGAFRLLPTLDTLSHHARPTHGRDALGLAELLTMLTVPEHGHRLAGHEYVWGEYGSFVGWGALLLAAAGVAWAWRHGRRRLPAGALVFGGLMLGSVSAFHPWALLHELPVFDSLRVPSRFAVLFIFYVALLAAGAVHALEGWLRCRRFRRGFDWTRPVLPWLLLVLIAGHLTLASRPIVDRWRGPALPEEMVTDRPFFHVPRGEYASHASFPARGVGNAGCYTGMTYRAARGLWEGEVPQVRVQGSAGQVHEERRTSNTVFADVTVERDAVLLFNHTFARGWHSSVGQIDSDAQGRLTVRVPRGRHRVRLTYEPPLLFESVATGLTGVLLALLTALCFTEERARRIGQRIRRLIGRRHSRGSPSDQP